MYLACSTAMGAILKCAKKYECFSAEFFPPTELEITDAATFIYAQGYGAIF